jgi:hypothetical protein
MEVIGLLNRERRSKPRTGKATRDCGVWTLWRGDEWDLLDPLDLLDLLVIEIL